MKTIFKETNNRFDALKEEIDFNRREKNVNKKEHNVFKRENTQKTQNTQKKEYSLVDSDFPTLLSEKPKFEIKTATTSFAEKVKAEGQLNKKVDDGLVIKPGWVSLHQDPKTRQIVWTYGPGTQQNESEKEYNPIVVLHALVKTYEKQIAYYDMLWGEGAYEKHYRSPYHDYDYFEKLDENEEDEHEEEEQ